MVSSGEKLGMRQLTKTHRRKVEIPREWRRTIEEDMLENNTLIAK